MYDKLDLNMCLVKIIVEIYVLQKICIKCLVVVTFLYLEMYQNNFFYFLKIIFNIRT